MSYSSKSLFGDLEARFVEILKVGESSTDVYKEDTTSHHCRHQSPLPEEAAVPSKAFVMHGSERWRRGGVTTNLRRHILHRPSRTDSTPALLAPQNQSLFSPGSVSTRSAPQPSIQSVLLTAILPSNHLVPVSRSFEPCPSVHYLIPYKSRFSQHQTIKIRPVP
ncbi:hypothetical protein Bca4012_049221 [Brassica carinata]